ncbi:hypothetical protein [Haemophilus paraphrohaemolyticus]|uniref:Uncharacterized protein n=1 Tax=Haemophilus paraphrohaemolyticus HK411 TaxID=1095743 RepID=I2NMY2_9PAST|nr:hypothetical protein [Haemophilus paraphrohaemolyticus]EIG27193.1 hypothetical protein HMPREF1054_1224 [Haemophilus paraphrohaemolyticus HK411]OOR95594.1 hypothetical protein B0184_03410 [Haemophilus paraphrohaemolyticus]STP00533.1 Uncharacterised protein [Haemophilus paraphrohaemolyticus]
MLIKIADIIGGTRRICKFLPKIDRLKRKKGKMKTYFYSYFMAKDPFEEYIRHVDARKKRRVSIAELNWFLQDVDGLKPSKFYVIYY